MRPGNADRVLAIDVGAGTMDVLIAERRGRPENSVKLVVPSRTVLAGRAIRAATDAGRDVVFAGPTMGSGACTRAARAHLRAGLRLFATRPAALTFTDDIAEAAGWGVRLITPEEATERVAEGAVEVRSGDVDLPALLEALQRVGVQTHFSAAAVAAQDHGFSPAGSNRVFRFGQWRRAVDERRPLLQLFRLAAELPPELTRLRAAAGCLADLEVPVVAGDTGPAALLGALPDGTDDAVLVNIGNGHTICAVALAGRLAGVFEHHTAQLDAPRLELLLGRFLAGRLDDGEVRAEGGHGAVLAADVPAGVPLLVTGPNRDLLAGGGLPVSFPAPFGDTMLAGPVGLVRAVRGLVS